MQSARGQKAKIEQEIALLKKALEIATENYIRWKTDSTAQALSEARYALKEAEEELDPIAYPGSRDEYRL